MKGMLAAAGSLIGSLQTGGLKKSGLGTKSYKELIKSGKYEGNYFLHPVILSNNSIVFNTHVSGGGYLVKLDSDGQIKAINENYVFRHSINIDKSGLIYVCIENKDNGREGFAILDQNLKVINTFYMDDIYTNAKLEARLFSSNSDDCSTIFSNASAIILPVSLSLPAEIEAT